MGGRKREEKGMQLFPSHESPKNALLYNQKCAPDISHLCLALGIRMDCTQRGGDQLCLKQEVLWDERAGRNITKTHFIEAIYIPQPVSVAVQLTLPLENRSLFRTSASAFNQVL